MTRPDLAFAVQVLSQYMHTPKQSHWEAALRVVKYVKEAPGLGLLMPSGITNELVAYCDSDWGGCLESRRSVTGYLVKLVKLPFRLQLIPSFMKEQRHIDIDCHFVREKIAQGMLKTEHIHTKEQLTDLFTKSLGRAQHQYLLGKLGLKNLFQPST
ncbi:secreted RxLR effector protein 161-like [Lycium barbarum]|uniref:secreted RxLR effector protein 161-like n=1 Tax=Lycium barbarum TaxID=112863 RepID=UPI00293F1831|nr:secreted RxLR effector protein 161-like [Lycium barbarum]